MFTKGVSRCIKCNLSTGIAYFRQMSTMPLIEYLSSPSQPSFDSTELYKWPIFRTKSTNRSTPLPLKTKLKPQDMSMVTQTERITFKSMFPDIVRDLTETFSRENLSDALRHFIKVLQYNVPNGELSRGLAVVTSYKMLSAENLTSENIQLANILGWCAELMQSSLIIDDDIMDGSTTRRGLPCWYIHTDVGMRAINDAEMLTNGIFLILKKYFSGRRCYVPLIELFHHTNFTTTMGQSLDTMCKVDEKPQFELFTRQRFGAIAKYKTAYLAYQFPMALAMNFAGIYDPRLHERAADILLEMGHYHQAENDVLDCFGDTAATGKEGTDIQEGKCTWLIVEALQRATRSQRKILECNYGRNEPECTNAVKALYEDMNLLKLFAGYEEQSFKSISRDIQQLPKDLPQQLFNKYAEKTYRQTCS